MTVATVVSWMVVAEVDIYPATSGLFLRQMSLARLCSYVDFGSQTPSIAFTDGVYIASELDVVERRLI